MANRRTFITGMLAAGLMPKPTWADVGNPSYLSAGMRPDGAYVLCGLSFNGQIAFELSLPSRGHAAAAHPTLAEAVAFARRPGTYAIVIDCTTGQETARLEAPRGRHFYGHGAFSDDGALLFTTENDYEAANGVVGIWDARRGYKRLGEFASGGTGPHDIKLLPDGTALVVANGGIETHPETGRTKLNIPTMRPNLSYLDPDGTLLDQIELASDYRRNSIRHLAVTDDGTVAFAMQWQGDLAEDVPLLGLHHIGEEPRLASSPDDAVRNMAGYAGSVAFSSKGDVVAITSPRGGMLQVFDKAQAALVGQAVIEDVCGVAHGPQDFFVTNGRGMIMSDPTTGSNKTTEHNIKWDNHLISI